MNRTSERRKQLRKGLVLLVRFVQVVVEEGRRPGISVDQASEKRKRPRKGLVLLGDVGCVGVQCKTNSADETRIWNNGVGVCFRPQIFFNKKASKKPTFA